MAEGGFSYFPAGYSVPVILGPFVDFVFYGPQCLFYFTLSYGKFFCTGPYSSFNFTDVESLVPSILFHYYNGLPFNVLIACKTITAVTAHSPPSDGGAFLVASAFQYFIVKRTTFWTIHISIISFFYCFVVFLLC